jgi:hypothetical protein
MVPAQRIGHRDVGTPSSAFQSDRRRLIR